MGQIASDPARLELARWAEPLIFDRLSEHYLAHDRPQATGLAYAQGEVWRALILGEEEQAVVLRGKLNDLAMRWRLPARIIAQADRTVLAELVAVVSLRFRRSRRTTCSLCLMLEDLLRQIKPETSTEAVPLDHAALAQSGRRSLRAPRLRFAAQPKVAGG